MTLMKRFTETVKWRDPWFRRLSPTAKLLWLYATDNCSNIGVIEIDWDALKFDFGCAVTEKHLDELGDRIQVVGGGKYFIPKFIRFQYGELSDACPAHRPIFKAISQHQLDRVALDYRYPSDRVAIPYRNGMEKDKDKEEGVQGETEKRSTIKNSTVIPETLDTPEFRAAWVMWLEHLSQKRKPPTLHAQDLQLRTLAAMGSAKAVTTIAYCIEHNWQGIYEPPTSAAHLKPNPRNAGIIKGPTNYATGKPRLQREREEREAAEGAQKEGVAGQVAQTHNHPPATGES